MHTCLRTHTHAHTHQLISCIAEWKTKKEMSPHQHACVCVLSHTDASSCRPGRKVPWTSRSWRMPWFWSSRRRWRCNHPLTSCSRWTMNWTKVTGSNNRTLVLATVLALPALCGCACVDVGMPVWVWVCLCGCRCACLDVGVPVWM